MPILRLLRTTHKSNLPSYSIQWKSDFLGKASMRARLPVDPEDSRTDRTVMRALSLLRAFRPGFTALTNRDLAEGTGLARSTVSRMTGALVRSGLLRQLPGTDGYAPTAACISLGFAALQSLSEPRRRVLATMQAAAEAEKVSVSLAIPDGDEMIYVDTFRKARGETLQHIAPGARVPMEFTALGHACIALQAPEDRNRRIEQLLMKHQERTRQVKAQITASLRHHAEHGWCRASWLSDIVGVARAVRLPGDLVLVFNCAGSTHQMSETKIHKKLVPLLFTLCDLAQQPAESSPAMKGGH